MSKIYNKETEKEDTKKEGKYLHIGSDFEGGLYLPTMCCPIDICHTGPLGS